MEKTPSKVKEIIFFSPSFALDSLSLSTSTRTFPRSEPRKLLYNRSTMTIRLAPSLDSSSNSATATSILWKDGRSSSPTSPGPKTLASGLAPSRHSSATASLATLTSSSPSTAKEATVKDGYGASTASRPRKKKMKKIEIIKNLNFLVILPRKI